MPSTLRFGEYWRRCESRDGGVPIFLITAHLVSSGATAQPYAGAKSLYPVLPACLPSQPCQPSPDKPRQAQASITTVYLEVS